MFGESREKHEAMKAAVMHDQTVSIMCTLTVVLCKISFKLDPLRDYVFASSIHTFMYTHSHYTHTHTEYICCRITYYY